MTETKAVDPKSQSASDVPYHNAETEKMAKDAAVEVAAKAKAEKIDALKAEIAELEAQ